jgi:hypothetical protein
MHSNAHELLDFSLREGGVAVGADCRECGVLQVLSPRRQLDKFSPQQLAAIAWSYAMVNYEAPQLFEAVQEEAMRKPPLAEMLSKAGLLRGSALGAFGGGGGGARPIAAAGNPNAGGGMGGHGPGAHMQGGMGNSAALGGSYQANHGGGAMQQRAQQAGGPQPGPQPNVAHPRGGQSAYQQQHPQGNALQQAAPTAYGNAGGGSGSGQDPTKGSEVARAAEEHKKEMEEKQRQVLGDEGGELCPLCVEEMDSTDMALMPCPCGYQVCLLCLNKIRNEGNKQCPACRSEYVPQRPDPDVVSLALPALRCGICVEDACRSWLVCRRAVCETWNLVQVRRGQVPQSGSAAEEEEERGGQDRGRRLGEHSAQEKDGRQESALAAQLPGLLTQGV